MKDVNTATELLNRRVDEASIKFFDHVEFQLKDAINKVQQARERFQASNGDHHFVQTLVCDLSHIDFGFDRAIKVVNNVTIAKEELETITQLQDTENDE